MGRGELTSGGGRKDQLAPWRGVAEEEDLVVAGDGLGEGV
jgi:hypothetical protein